LILPKHKKKGKIKTLLKKNFFIIIKKIVRIKINNNTIQKGSFGGVYQNFINKLIYYLKY
jgi:hypothetical protein